MVLPKLKQKYRVLLHCNTYDHNLSKETISIKLIYFFYLGRPWLVDNLDDWIERLETGKPHKCAAIFVDNSGVDIILGILPFARDLLLRGTKVSWNIYLSIWS